MKNRMFLKLIVPLTGVLCVFAIIAGWMITTNLESVIQARAIEQVGSSVRSIEDALLIVDNMSLERVHSAMRLLQRESEQAGTPQYGPEKQVGSSRVPDLLFGGSAQANRFDLVDRVTAVAGGTATIFVRSGEDFFRISTNVKQADGSRAIGTRLDPNGRAIAAIRQNMSFYGVVDILGTPFMTGYEPVRDKNRQTIGVCYVGFPLSSLTQLGRTISQMKVLDHGFVALLDDKGRIAFVSTSVDAADAERILGAENADAPDTFVIQKKSFPQWGYSIVVAYPSGDISGKINQARIVVLIVTVLLVAILLLFFSTLVNSLLTRPVKSLARHANIIAQGDLTVAIEQQSNDEIGQLAESFRTMVGNLRKALSKVAEASAAVASASTQISSSTEEMAAGSQEQTSQSAEVARAVEEMTHTIVDNSRNAATTAETARMAKMAAEKGGTVVSETIEGMKRISDVVRKSAATVAELGNSSQQIGDIISVIDDIADQTNLLALNAAIEAARAGEQGRGFAVVADEVRKLAARTTNATKEIADTIRKIQQDTQGAVSSMKEGTLEVNRGIESTDKAGAVLSEIVALSQKVTDMVAQIASASAQQSQTSEDIAKNIEAISSVTAETAQGTDQIAKTAEELSRLTDNLQKLIAEFRLSEDTRTTEQSPRYAPIYREVPAPAYVSQ